MIDPHVHLRDWNQSEKETLAHGLAAAQAASLQAVFDMPNTDPPLTDRATIKQRLADVAALKLPIAYHLWAGLTSKPAQIQEAVTAVFVFYPQVVGLKLFAGQSTGKMGIVSAKAQRKVYKELTDQGYTGVVAVHCEKEELFSFECYDANDLSTHSDARPIEAEVASVADQIRLSAEVGFEGHLHICHISSSEAVALVTEAKKAGRRISCGATPHHLLLNSDMAKDRTLWAKMNPPLRTESERAALYADLLAGRIDWIESDHAPHTLADKEGGASGIPGFSGLLLLLSRLRKDGLSEAQLTDLFGKRVAKLIGLRVPITLVPEAEIAELSADLAARYPYDSFASLR